MIARNTFNIKFKHNIINTNKIYNTTYSYNNIKFKCTKCGMQICGFWFENKNKVKFYKKDIINCNDYLIKSIIE